MASNPFKISGPACISFSGGRSSAYMLYKILQAYDGKLPEDVFVVFANTGKEHEATLDFVDDCATRWGVDIHWVELGIQDKTIITNEVCYLTASRDGKPFNLLLKIKKILPNGILRFCTQELKVRRIEEFMVKRGYKEYTTILGVRADEKARVSKIRGRQEDKVMPLAVANIQKLDVIQFWKDSDFDLKLKFRNGHTEFGNCDLCYLKGNKSIPLLISKDPSRADWWIEAEESIPVAGKKGTHATFRKGYPYRELKKRGQLLKEKGSLLPESDDLILVEDITATEDCFCGD